MSDNPGGNSEREIPSKPMSRRARILCAVAVILVILCCCGNCIVKPLVEREDVITVCRVDLGGKSGTNMMVYAAYGETYKVDDNWLQGQFTSADEYGELREGKTFVIKYTGFRTWNTFPTIHEVELAPDHLQDPAVCDERSEAFVLAA